jgi:hypothetical protein
MPNLSDFPNALFGFSFTEYLTIFVGLVFALAVGEFFLSLGGLIRHRQHVQFYWEYVVWLFVILDFFLLSWFAGWPRLEYIKASLFDYVVITTPYLVANIIVAIYFPEIQGEVNLKVHFKHNRTYFFLLLASYIFINAIMDLFMPVGYQGFLPVEFIYTALLVVAAFYDKVWYRTLLAIIIFGDLISAMFVLHN